MKNYDLIVKAISEQVWAIHPPKLQEIIGVVEARMQGVVLETDRWQQIKERREAHLGTSRGVAVLGMHGTISQKVGLMTGSGGVSTEEFGRQLQSALADEQTKSIVVDIDSPGGSVFGLRELADKIYAARGKKKMIGVVNPEAHSAAYYVGSGFDEVVVTPSGMGGSIGTMMAHIDKSKMNEELGLKVTYIHAGRYKVEGNSDEPLTDEARDDMQRIVNHYYADFVSAVARHRGVSAKTVEDRFGQGRIFPAGELVERGMADRVATLEQVVGELQSRPATTMAGARRQAERKFQKHVLTSLRGQS